MILVKVRQAVIEKNRRSHGGRHVEVDVALRNRDRDTPGVCVISFYARPLRFWVGVHDVVEVPGCGGGGHGGGG